MHSAATTTPLDAALASALADFWPGVELRPAQHEAIAAVLAGHDSFVGLRTGYGKSLCFQLPAAARRGVTVVITPLLALATDQLNDLDERGIIAHKLTSDVDRERRARIVADLEDDDDPETKLLYLTPEGLAKEATLSLLHGLHAKALLNAIAVDEAHCVSKCADSDRTATPHRCFRCC